MFIYRMFSSVLAAKPSFLFWYSIEAKNIVIKAVSARSKSFPRQKSLNLKIFHLFYPDTFKLCTATMVVLMPYDENVFIFKGGTEGIL